MTLLNAPAYDEHKEKMQRNALIGAGVLFVLAILITLGGFIAGHGWAFSNLGAEHRVGNFFAALEAKDYGKAFGIYNNDEDWKQHPEKYKDYPEKRFESDWSTQDPIDGPVNSYHVDISRTDGTGRFGSGIIVAVTVNKSAEKDGKRVFMYYVRKDGTLSWPAYHEIQY